MMGDWKDVLAGLSSTLPPGEDNKEAEQEIAPKKKCQVRVSIDRKQRKGKTATLIEGFDDPGEDVAEVAAMLKKRLGCGGSQRGGDILIQGDRRNDVVKILNDLGYKTKLI